MQILLLAYEWPPIAAAQALRWFYLANGLASCGIKVHVLCPNIVPLSPFLATIHPNIVEHRVWPGPFIGLAQKLSKSIPRINSDMPLGKKNASPFGLVSIYKVIRYFLDRIIYPDVRTEWYPFARYRLKQLLHEYSFDAVISSHEPGVDLLLGLWVQKYRSLPWIVDLADPLCTPYTPRWRQKLDVWFEGFVLHRADKVILTTDLLLDVLMRRHAELKYEKFAIIPQGAPDEVCLIEKNIWSKPRKLHIVFTGNFYEKFRNPEEFAKALRFLNNPDIALTVAGDNIHFAHFFDGIQNVEFLGRLGHFECLTLQAAANVLLNIGNAQNYQVPGKIFEYLVTGKAIMHLRGSKSDPSECILNGIPSSFVVDNEFDSIVDALKQLVVLWNSGQMEMAECDIVKMKKLHGWSARSIHLKDLLESFNNEK